VIRREALKELRSGWKTNQHREDCPLVSQSRPNISLVGPVSCGIWALFRKSGKSTALKKVRPKEKMELTIKEWHVRWKLEGKEKELAWNDPIVHWDYFLYISPLNTLETG
jgi:hypothetical protein